MKTKKVTLTVPVIPGFNKAKRVIKTTHSLSTKPALRVGKTIVKITGVKAGLSFLGRRVAKAWANTK